MLRLEVITLSDKSQFLQLIEDGTSRALGVAIEPDWSLIKIGTVIRDLGIDVMKKGGRRIRKRNKTLQMEG